MSGTVHILRQKWILFLFFYCNLLLMIALKILVTLFLLVFLSIELDMRQVVAIKK